MRGRFHASRLQATGEGVGFQRGGEAFGGEGAAQEGVREVRIAMQAAVRGFPMHLRRLSPRRLRAGVKVVGLCAKARDASGGVGLFGQGRLVGQQLRQEGGGVVGQGGDGALQPAVAGDLGGQGLRRADVCRHPNLYSLYLFHPVSLSLVAWAQGRGLLAGVGGPAAEVLGALILAWASYRLVERPLLAWRARLKSTVTARKGPDIPTVAAA